MNTYPITDIVASERRKIVGNDETVYQLANGDTPPTLAQREILRRIFGQRNMIIQIGGYGFWSQRLEEIAMEQLVIVETNNVAINNVNMSGKVKGATYIASSPLVALSNILKQKAQPKSLLLITLEHERQTVKTMTTIFDMVKKSYSESVWMLLDKSVAKKLKIPKINLFKMYSVKSTPRGRLKVLEHLFYTNDRLSSDHVYTDRSDATKEISNSSLCVWLPP